jgi:hypothetical protein
MVAAAAITPGLGFFLRKTVAPWNAKMPTLKATWSNVFDSYGQHHFQRYLPHNEFAKAVRAAGFSCIASPEAGVVRALK